MSETLEITIWSDSNANIHSRDEATMEVDAEEWASMTDEELDFTLEMELEAQEQAEVRQPSPVRRPLTEWEQEERWRQDDLMERRAAFMREDY